MNLIINNFLFGIKLNLDKLKKKLKLGIKILLN